MSDNWNKYNKSWKYVALGQTQSCIDCANIKNEKWSYSLCGEFQVVEGGQFLYGRWQGKVFFLLDVMQVVLFLSLVFWWFCNFSAIYRFQAEVIVLIGLFSLEGDVGPLVDCFEDVGEAELIWGLRFFPCELA
jgi:hypothetical protein